METGVPGDSPRRPSGGDRLVLVLVVMMLMARAAAQPPEDGGKGRVSDRADEAQHRDQGAGDHVLDRAQHRRPVLDEESIEEVVAEEADEAGEQEADRDLLPEHQPVAPEVLSHPAPRLRRAEPLAPAPAATPAAVDVAGLRLLRVLPGLLLQ